MKKPDFLLFSRRLLICLLLYASIPDSLAQLNFQPFLQLGFLTGVGADQQDNLFVSHEFQFNSLVSKFSPSAQLQYSINLGSDVESFGRFTRLSNGTLLDLFGNGLILQIEPSNGQSSFILNLRQLNIDNTSIYDHAPGVVGNMVGIIQPWRATYGDIASLEGQGFFMLFVTAVNDGFPYTIRLSFKAFC